MANKTFSFDEAFTPEASLDATAKTFSYEDAITPIKEVTPPKTFSFEEASKPLRTTPAEPVESSLLRETADIPLKGASGVVTGVKMLSDVFGANNPVSRGLDTVDDFIAQLYSAQSKADSQEIAAIMKAAEDKGLGNQVLAALKAFTVAPLDFTASAAGTAVPTILGGIYGQALKLGNLGVRGIQLGLGAATGAGVTKGAIYESVKEELSKTEMPPDQVEARAQLAQSYNGENLDQILFGTAISGLAGTTGVEPALVKSITKKILGDAGTVASKSVAKAMGTGAVKEAIPEVLQGGQEQAARNIALQREGFDVPTMRGVAGQAALEGFAGAGLGGGISAMTQTRVNNAVQAKEAAEEALKASKIDEEIQQNRDAYIKSLKEEMRSKAQAIKEQEAAAAAEADTTPVDTTPVDTTPVDTTPVDTTPVDTTPVDTTPLKPGVLDAATLTSFGLNPRSNAFKELSVGEVDLTTKEGLAFFEETLNKHTGKINETAVGEYIRSLAPTVEATNESIETTPIETTGDRAGVSTLDEQQSEIPTERAVEVDRGTVDVAGTDVGQPARGTESVGTPLEALQVGDTTVIGNQTYRKTDTGFEIVPPAEAVAVQTPEVSAVEDVQPEAVVEETQGVDPTAQAKNISSRLRSLDPTNPLIEDLLAFDVNEDTIAEANDAVAQLVQERQAKGQTQPSELRELSDDVAETESDIEVDDDTRFSREAEGRPATQDDAHDATTLDTALKNLFVTPSTYKGKVKIYNTEEEARMAGALPDGQEGVQGFVRQGVATFIAENIAKGRELGVFLHELGAHLGFDTILSTESRDQLGNQIIKWAMGPNDGSQESVISMKALERAQADRFEDSYLDEVIAYFVEEAVNAGVDPQAINKIQNKRMRDWFRKFMSLMRTALRKIGLNKFDTLTTQNIVDLAYGAADLELSGAWHGTAANFRRFDNRFMGAGEGAQAFGYGTYLAQRSGIGKDYMVEDVKRKTKKSIIRADYILGITEEIPVTIGEDRSEVYYVAPFSRVKIGKPPLRVLSTSPSTLNTGNESILYVEARDSSGRFHFFNASKIISEKTGDYLVSNLDVLPLVDKYIAATTRSDAKLSPEERSLANDYRDLIASIENTIELQKNTPKLLEQSKNRLREVKKELNDLLTKKEKPEGSLLRVRPLVAESELLDWNALIEDQPKAVRDIIENSIPDYIMEDAEEFGTNVTGQTLYRAIQNAANEGDNRIWGDTTGEDPQKAASMYLDRLGIPGLKFLDALSRGPAEYNRVEVRDAGYVTSWMNGPWEVIKLGPGGGFVFGTYKTEAEAKKASKLAEKELADAESARTRNLVIFNDRNLSRVATLKDADKEKIRYSKKQAVEKLQKKSGIKKPSNNAGKSLFKSVMEADLNHAIDNLSSAVLSSDNGLNNQMRTALEKAGMPWPDIQKILEGLMTSQATHSQNVAAMFLEMGSITYDEAANMFQVTENPNGSYGAMMETIGELAKKYKISEDAMNLAAHTYFVSNRSRGLIKTNERLKKRALAKELEGKSQEADKLLDKVVLVNMTPAEIKAGLDIRKEIPEIGKIVEQFNVVRLEVINHLANTGLYSQEEAAEIADTFDYVPFYREAQIEANEGPKENTRGLLDRTREKHIKGSYNPVNNVFDNINRWVTYSIARGINNSQGLYAVNAMQQNMVGSISPDPLPPTTKVPPGNLVAVWDNGVEKRYRVEDPMFVHYFTGARAAYAPLINTPIITGVNKLFRANIILDPVFSASQVFMDGLGAMFTSGTKHFYMIPIRAIKEFVLTIPNWSKTHKTLRGFGAVGETDFASVSKRISEEIKRGQARDYNTAEKIANTLLKPLRWITTASDNAIRQAVYEQEMAESGNQSTAIRKAFEIINFRRGGYSSRVNTLRQSVTFTGAYLQVINVQSKIATGKGITPTQKKQTYVRLFNSLAGFGLFSFINLMAVSDDDEYKKADQTTLDLRMYLPGLTEKLGIWLPVRADPFMLIAKMIPEHIFNLSRKEGGEDWTKFKKAFKAYMSAAMLGPTPMPQLPKTVLETMMNKSMNTGRDIVGQGIEGRETERQFTSTTSEFSKMLGRSGLVSPVIADYWINNLGASVGRSFILLTNSLMKDSEAPEKSMRDTLASFAPKFIKREGGTRAKNDLYELRDIVDEAYLTYKDIQKYGSEAEYNKKYQETIDKVMEKPGIDIALKQLAQIRSEERMIRENPPAEYTKEFKEAYLEELREREQIILFDVQLKRDLSGLDKDNPFRKSK